MQRLPHGYTNSTTRQGGVVTKCYDGPDAAGRQEREASVLRALSGELPVPHVIASDQHGLRLGFLPGLHGQDLIERGRAGSVLLACGRMLQRIHAVSPGRLPAGWRWRPGRCWCTAITARTTCCSIRPPRGSS
jgi:hypothetical protein